MKLLFDLIYFRSTAIIDENERQDKLLEDVLRARLELTKATRQSRETRENSERSIDEAVTVAATATSSDQMRTAINEVTLFEPDEASVFMPCQPKRKKMYFYRPDNWREIALFRNSHSNVETQQHFEAEIGNLNAGTTFRL